MIITRLEQILGDLSPSEKKVAQYILDNPKETIKLNVQEIAEASMSSSAAVVRLCKHIDVKGFTELKNMLFDSLSGSDNLSKPYYVPDFDKEADGKAIINKLVSSVCQNAQMLTAILSNKDVEKAAKLILSAKKMYINIQLHKNKDFFSNSGPFFRFCKTKKTGFPGFRARCAAFAVAGNRKRLRRPSNPLSGRTRAFALANSKKTSFAQAKVAACVHAKIPCPRFLIKIDILDFFAKNNSKIF